MAKKRKFIKLAAEECLIIDDPELEKLIVKLAALKGMTIAQTIREAADREFESLCASRQSDAALPA